MSAPDHTTRVQQLFIKHLDDVRYFIVSILPNPSQTEDIVQEVFLTMTAKAHDFDPNTNFRAWVFTIARFKVLELTRREKRINNRLVEPVIEQLASDAEVLDPIDNACRKQALIKCLAKLAPRARQVIELQYRENLGPAVIARKLGWGTNAVYVALSRARQTLRRCVEREEGIV